MFRPLFHILLHFVVPGIVARFGFKKNWKYAWLIMVLTMAVDLDHLLANPVYAPGRCSIGYHPLHSYWVMGVYVLMLYFPKTRLVGIGLVIHMLLDGLDCFWMKLV